MYYSKNKRLYTLLLDKLNANTQKLENGNDVVFSGNWMFKFSNTSQGVNFAITSREADSLEFTATEYIPFVDVQSIQVPFVELNKRDDWEREFYVAIEIPRSRHSVTGEFEYVFQETNPRYQAVLETIEKLSDDLTFVDDGYKYTFKVKEPTKVDVFTYNGKYYQVLAMTFNLTSLEKGFFGNETKAYLGLKTDSSFGETADYLLDIVELNEIMGKTSRATSNINEIDETKTADKRIWEANVTINFNGNNADILIYKEKACISDIALTYQIKITNKNLNTLVGENLDYTIDVIISNVNITYKNNVVDMLTFKLERA